jgi:hypothetical protein
LVKSSEFRRMAKRISPSLDALGAASLVGSGVGSGAVAPRFAARRSLALRPLAMSLCAALLLGGCSFASDTLWPSLTGDAPNKSGRPAGTAPTQTVIPIAPSAAETNQNAFAAPASAGIVPITVSQAPATGTFVGQKVQQTRAELAQLQTVIAQRNTALQSVRVSTNQSSQRYYGTIAAITTRLQMGTTPGNPILVGQWNQAQADLDKLSSDIAALASLGNEVAADSAMSAYLLSNIKATYRMSGAIDEDHRQLAVLEDETNRSVVLIDRLLNEISQDVTRQTAYLGAERGNLTTLSLSIKNGELMGPALVNRAYSNITAGLGDAPGRVGATAADGRQPLVVIRFDQPDVQYQQALYNAVSRALERRPQAQFDLVAVAMGDGAQGALGQSQSRRNAERVMRSLTEMGLPANRISMSAATSTQAASNEVHLYIR